MPTLRYVLLGLAVCVLAVLGWRLATSVPSGTAPSLPQSAPVAAVPNLPVPALPNPPAVPPADARPEEIHAEVEIRLAEVPQYATFFRKLDAVFPRLYAKLVEGWTSAVSSHGPMPSADAMVWQAERELQQSQGVLAGRAADEPLRAFFDARLSLLDALAPENAGLCADFLYGNPDASLERFSATHRDVVAGLALGELDAVASGVGVRASPVGPTAADLDLVASGLSSRGLSAAESELLLDGKPLDPPPSDARICELGRIYLAVLKGLPADSRQRVYGLAAELLARS